MVDAMSIFVDAGPFIAFCSKRDENHELSKLIFNEIDKGHYGEIITSDYIVTETVNFLFKKGQKEDALLLGKRIFGGYNVTHVDEIIFQSAWSKFSRLKPFSLTDCTNLAIIEKYNVETIFTFDSEFKSFVKTVGLS